jgi:hypothetical protein
MNINKLIANCSKSTVEEPKKLNMVKGYDWGKGRHIPDQDLLRPSSREVHGADDDLCDRGCSLTDVNSGTCFCRIYGYFD